MKGEVRAAFRNPTIRRVRTYFEATAVARALARERVSGERGGRMLGRPWADVGQTLGRPWPDLGHSDFVPEVRGRGSGSAAQAAGLHNNRLK